MSRTTEQAFHSETLQATARNIKPPEWCNVPEDALPFWDSIISTKHAKLWSPSDLLVAANLARVTLELETLSASNLQRIEGGKVSAAHKVMSDLTSQQASLCRALQIHSRAIHGEARRQQPKNRLWSDSLDSPSELGLIPWPKS